MRSIIKFWTSDDFLIHSPTFCFHIDKKHRRHLKMGCQIFRRWPSQPKSRSSFSNRDRLRWSHFVWMDTWSRNDRRTQCLIRRIRRQSASSVSVFILFPTNGKTRLSVIFTSFCMTLEWIALHFPKLVSFSVRPNELGCETCCGKNGEQDVRILQHVCIQSLLNS